jgi:hypothetical protein
MVDLGEVEFLCLKHFDHSARVGNLFEYDNNFDLLIYLVNILYIRGKEAS